MENISRRHLLLSSVTLGALAVTHSAFGQTIADLCGLTPKQTEGPFYPVKDQADKDNDLTIIRGASAVAKGQITYLSGIVSDENCAPIRNAVVEIWQACASGRYNHPGDTSGNPLDHDFQYWGKSTTDAKGKYDFKTITPGHYLAEPTWMRPPHIHFKIHAKGFPTLTTQMYFAGNKYNETDLILNEIAAGDRDRVIVDFKSVNNPQEPDAQKGLFDITLKRV